MTTGTGQEAHWTVGADGLRPVDRAGGWRYLPVGRLHAVGDDGLLVGRSVCLAAVTLLDPAEWAWPEDRDDAGDPLCWICLALTC